MVNTSNYEFFWLSLPFLSLAVFLTAVLLAVGAPISTASTPTAIILVGMGITAVLEYVGDRGFIKQPRADQLAAATDDAQRD